MVVMEAKEAAEVQVHFIAEEVMVEMAEMVETVAAAERAAHLLLEGQTCRR